ncbi:MAG TPA: hypothetical protein VIS48_05765 [Candidatus Kryptonia bacterium]
MQRARNSLLFLIFVSVNALAQPQIINFRELQQFLPQADYEVYKRARPTGETSSMMGFSSSWAQVNYIYTTDSSVSSISVKITDMLNLPSYMSISPTISGDMDRETETGYERTTMHKDTKVLESYDTVAHQGKLQFLVARRFLVEITGMFISNTKPLYALFDMIDLDGLRKIVSENNMQNK